MFRQGSPHTVESSPPMSPSSPHEDTPRAASKHRKRIDSKDPKGTPRYEVDLYDSEQHTIEQGTGFFRDILNTPALNTPAPQLSPPIMNDHMVDDHHHMVNNKNFHANYAAGKASMAELSDAQRPRQEDMRRGYSSWDDVTESFANLLSNFHLLQEKTNDEIEESFFLEVACEYEHEVCETLLAKGEKWVERDVNDDKLRNESGRKEETGYDFRLMKIPIDCYTLVLTDVMRRIDARKKWSEAEQKRNNHGPTAVFDQKKLMKRVEEVLENPFRRSLIRASEVTHYTAAIIQQKRHLRDLKAKRKQQKKNERQKKNGNIDGRTKSDESGGSREEVTHRIRTREEVKTIDSKRASIQDAAKSGRHAGSGTNLSQRLDENRLDIPDDKRLDSPGRMVRPSSGTNNTSESNLDSSRGLSDSLNNSTHVLQTKASSVTSKSNDGVDSQCGVDSVDISVIQHNFSNASLNSMSTFPDPGTTTEVETMAVPDRVSFSTQTTFKQTRTNVVQTTTKVVNTNSNPAAKSCSVTRTTVSQTNVSHTNVSQTNLVHTTLGSATTIEHATRLGHNKDFGSDTNSASQVSLSRFQRKKALQNASTATIEKLSCSQRNLGNSPSLMRMMSTPSDANLSSLRSPQSARASPFGTFTSNSASRTMPNVLRKKEKRSVEDIFRTQTGGSSNAGTVSENPAVGKKTTESSRKLRKSAQSRSANRESGGNRDSGTAAADQRENGPFNGNGTTIGSDRGNSSTRGALHENGTIGSARGEDVGFINRLTAAALSELFSHRPMPHEEEDDDLKLPILSDKVSHPSSPGRASPGTTRRSGSNSELNFSLSDKNVDAIGENVVNTLDSSHSMSENGSVNNLVVGAHSLNYSSHTLNSAHSLNYGSHDERGGNDGDLPHNSRKKDEIGGNSQSEIVETEEGSGTPTTTELQSIMQTKMNKLQTKHTVLIERKTEITMTWHQQCEELYLMFESILTQAIDAQDRTAVDFEPKGMVLQGMIEMSPLPPRAKAKLISALEQNQSGLASGVIGSPANRCAPVSPVDGVDSAIGSPAESGILSRTLSPTAGLFSGSVTPMSGAQRQRTTPPVLETAVSAPGSPTIPGTGCAGNGADVTSDFIFIDKTKAQTQRGLISPLLDKLDGWLSPFLDVFVLGDDEPEVEDIMSFIQNAERSGSSNSKRHSIKTNRSQTGRIDELRPYQGVKGDPNDFGIDTVTSAGAAILQQLAKISVRCVDCLRYVSYEKYEPRLELEFRCPACLLENKMMEVERRWRQGAVAIRASQPPKQHPQEDGEKGINQRSGNTETSGQNNSQNGAKPPPSGAHLSQSLKRRSRSFDRCGDVRVFLRDGTVAFYDIPGEVPSGSTSRSGNTSQDATGVESETTTVNGSPVTAPTPGFVSESDDLLVWERETENAMFLYCQPKKKRTSSEAKRMNEPSNDATNKMNDSSMPDNVGIGLSLSPGENMESKALSEGKSSAETKEQSELKYLTRVPSDIEKAGGQHFSLPRSSHFSRHRRSCSDSSICDNKIFLGTYLELSKGYSPSTSNPRSSVPEDDRSGRGGSGHGSGPTSRDENGHGGRGGSHETSPHSGHQASGSHQYHGNSYQHHAAASTQNHAVAMHRHTGLASYHFGPAHPQELTPQYQQGLSAPQQYLQQSISSESMPGHPYGVSSRPPVQHLPLSSTSPLLLYQAPPAYVHHLPLQQDHSTVSQPQSSLSGATPGPYGTPSQFGPHGTPLQYGPHGTALQYGPHGMHLYAASSHPSSQPYDTPQNYSQTVSQCHTPLAHGVHPTEISKEASKETHSSKPATSKQTSKDSMKGDSVTDPTNALRHSRGNSEANSKYVTPHGSPMTPVVVSSIIFNTAIISPPLSPTTTERPGMVGGLLHAKTSSHERSVGGAPGKDKKYAKRMNGILSEEDLSHAIAVSEARMRCKPLTLTDVRSVTYVTSDLDDGMSVYNTSSGLFNETVETKMSALYRIRRRLLEYARELNGLHPSIEMSIEEADFEGNRVGDVVRVGEGFGFIRKDDLTGREIVSNRKASIDSSETRENQTPTENQHANNPNGDHHPHTPNAAATNENITNLDGIQLGNCNLDGVRPGSGPLSGMQPANLAEMGRKSDNLNALGARNDGVTKSQNVEKDAPFVGLFGISSQSTIYHESPAEGNRFPTRDNSNVVTVDTSTFSQPNLVASSQSNLTAAATQDEDPARKPERKPRRNMFAELTRRAEEEKSKSPPEQQKFPQETNPDETQKYPQQMNSHEPRKYLQQTSPPEPRDFPVMHQTGSAEQQTLPQQQSSPPKQQKIPVVQQTSPVEQRKLPCSVSKQQSEYPAEVYKSPKPVHKSPPLVRR